MTSSQIGQFVYARPFEAFVMFLVDVELIVSMKTLSPVDSEEYIR